MPPKAKIDTVAKSRGGRRSSVPARERAYSHIRSLINRGILAPGKPLSELLLAKEMGSSRTPIREAIGLLTAEGLLETTHNRGAVVRKLTRSDIIDLCEVREALEVFTAEKAARKGMTSTEIENLEATITGIQELREGLNGEEPLDEVAMQKFIQLDRRFHEQIVLLTLNRAMQDILRKAGVLVQIFAMPRRGHDCVMLDRVLVEHKQIVEALQKHQTQEVRRLLGEHIQNSMRERLEEFDWWERNQILASVASRMAANETDPSLI
jgi:DNA-binding GntR family transcriptional regulator